MTHLNNLVPKDPVSLCVSINDRTPLLIVGSEFVTFGLLGSAGAPVNLFFAGLDPAHHDTQHNKGTASVVLNDGDSVTISVQDTKASDAISVARDFKNVISTHSSSLEKEFIENIKFLGWRFRMDFSDGTHLSATSIPFETIQIIITWRPGEPRASFHVESLTIMEDGTTNGKSWGEGVLSSGMSLNIKIEGLPYPAK